MPEISPVNGNWSALLLVAMNSIHFGPFAHAHQECHVTFRLRGLPATRHGQSRLASTPVFQRPPANDQTVHYRG
jgi:hypothetical protein